MLFFSLLSYLHCSLCWFSLFCSAAKYLGIFFGLISRTSMNFLLWNSVVSMSVYLTPSFQLHLKVYFENLYPRPPLLPSFCLSGARPPQRSWRNLLDATLHRREGAEKWKPWFPSPLAATFQSGTMASWIRPLPRILSPGLESPGRELWKSWTCFVCPQSRMCAAAMTAVSSAA